MRLAPRKNVLQLDRPLFARRDLGDGKHRRGDPFDWRQQGVPEHRVRSMFRARLLTHEGPSAAGPSTPTPAAPPQQRGETRRASGARTRG